MMDGFVIPAATPGSPDTVDRRRKMAELMMAQAGRAEPISHWSQGLNKMAQALIGGLSMRRADQQEAEGRKNANEMLARALSGDMGSAPSQQDPNGSLVQAMNDPWMSPQGQQMLYQQWQQQNQPYKPDWQTLTSNGDTYRWDQNNPNAKPELFFDGPGEAQKAPQVETFFDEKTGQQYKAQWDGQKWVPIGGQKAGENGIVIENADGSRTIIGGSAGAKTTEADRRAELLIRQIVGQENELMTGFDSLASPQNYVGSQVPGGSAVMTGDAQIAEDAIKNVVANWLYLTSGATATDAEIDRQFSIIRPSPLDKPERIVAKRARLQMILDTMKMRAGMETSPPEKDDGGDWTILPDGTKIRQKGQ